MNISSLQTPGVYINEIDAFPPSVAQVATAIPAFIGYTEKRPSTIVTPTRITSMLDYEQKFGGAPSPKILSIPIADGVPTDGCTVSESKFKLYYSMQLFYANGGGDCYIVSIGTYTDNPVFDAATKTAFIAGLKTLEKYDEPTLILFPDAVNLVDTDLGELQKQALMQCNDLMDRFVIMDVQQNGNDGVISDCGKFRDNIGNSNLKYGAAYYPYLQANFPNQFKFTDINTALLKNAGGGMKQFFGTSDTDVKIKDSIDAFVSMATFIKSLRTNWGNTNKEFVNLATIEKKLTTCWDMLKVFGDPDSILNTNFKSYFNSEIITNKLFQFATKLVDFQRSYDKLTILKVDGKTAGLVNPIGILIDPDIDGIFNGSWNKISDIDTSASKYYYDTDTNTSRIGTFHAADNNLGIDEYCEPNDSSIIIELNKLLLQIINGIESAISSIDKYEAIEENNLISQIPIYALIIAKLNRSMNTLPPSGAIAGVYAQIDGTRGVWKAPANVSLNGIIGLTDDINDHEQGPMNVHETGKSINAIRKFTGRGFMVWGGRTLDGNSNDWRYVNVRRLANMIEESVKKACMRYVFEPNVAQTWVNVKGMIENYLTNLWTDGALAGAKSEHAFFVAVGINQTMTARDILEGRMIVKVGYCPSRPAEFIVLEFKQMQQKS